MKHRVPDLDAAIGARLRTAREHRNVTAVEMAAKLGVSIPTLSSIERGVTAPQAATVARYAHLLRIPADFFFNDLF